MLEPKQQLRKPRKVRRDTTGARATDGGVIVVVGQDGTTNIERDETDGLAALITAIARALRK
jgi:hypothetical protein